MSFIRVTITPVQARHGDEGAVDSLGFAANANELPKGYTVPVLP